MLRKLSLLLLIVFSLCIQVYAAQPTSISALDESIDLTSSLEFNLVNTHALGALPIKGWSPHLNHNVLLKNSTDTYWFRTKLKNTLAQTKTFYLELDNPLIDELSVHVLFEGNIVTSLQLGDKRSFSQRAVIHESFLVPIQFAANQELEIYFALHSPSYLHVPVTLWQIDAFQKAQSNQRLSSGIYIGLIIATLIAIFVVFAYSRDFILLFDSLFILSLLMITLTASGIGFHYLWPNSPTLQQHAFYLFACLAMFFSALAAKNNAQSFFYDERLLTLFKGLALISLLLIPTTLLVPYQLGLFLIIGLSIIMSIVHISTGVYAWRNGFREHQELNYGLLVLLITLLLINVNSFNLIALPITNLTLLKIGVLIQAIVILVTAINNNVGVFDEDSNDFDDKDLQLSEQMLELQFALKELQEKNEQLEKLNTLDELSGIHNRRHFDKRLQAELRRGRRELTPLSLIIFDIDHFKKFNDTYGHTAGDEVIRGVAFTASEQLSRESDDIFRYGGEEYAILLPNTELDGATFIAEKVRLAIESLTINCNGQALNCTISLGVACHLSEQALQPKSFIEQADKALYQAKKNGRNQTIQFNQSR